MAENSKIEFRYINRSANRLGISRDEFLARQHKGEKWCARCRSWHSKDTFGIDRGNSDGLLPFCRESTHRTVRKPHAGGRKKGSAHTPETRERMAAAHSGARNHKWKGGITPLTRKARQNAKYQAWRRSVFKRDNKICKKCGIAPRFPHAHHIKSFKAHPELRIDVTNGITLCAQCHRDVHAEDKHNG